MQKGIVYLPRRPAILAAASVVGKEESLGPLGGGFDIVDPTDRFGADTWEKSESEMQRRALTCALDKLGWQDTDLDVMLAGDLINQCTGSNYGLLGFDVPYFGLYGACSTVAEGLVLASLLYGGGFYDRLGVVSSSHNCSAERQFRFPVEYGGQRAPTAQWTVTGAGAFILGEGGGARIAEVLPGRAIDKGICDVNNMGAAMAPAAMDTLSRYLDESGRAPTDFDAIVTGDLGYEGSEIFCDILTSHGYPVRSVHRDCGLMIYRREAQDKHAGGSGCGCSGVTLASYFLPRLARNEIRDILFMATGALMSPMSLQQGNNIPGIAHLLRITAEEVE